MSTVLKKGAPSRSYPSRQRKLGPAPFASFEDLSDELESPADGQHGSSDYKVEVLPEIKEDMGRSPTPHADDEVARGHRPVTATSSTVSNVTFAPSYSQPASGPTSGLQTPSTPRIDISCASSSTPPSEDSTSEKELFQGGLGFAFHEEGTEELRSSTEELDLGEVDIDSEEEKRQKRREKEDKEDIYRRASHPANIFRRRKSSNVLDYDEHHQHDDLQRKPSAHTLFLDGLLSRPACRHASFGSAEYGNNRAGAISSMSAHSSGSRGRSPSPHKLMLETSFCGGKPIPTKSMDMESPPKQDSPDDDTETATLTTTQMDFKTNSSLSIANINRTPPCNSSSSNSIKKPTALTEPSSPRTPPRSPKSPRDFDRRPSSGRRSVSPFKMVYETSFCGSKPIPTKSMEQDSPPKDLPDLSLGAFLASFSTGTTTTTVQVHQHQTSPAATDHQRSHRALTPDSPKSSDHWKPVSPRAGGGGTPNAAGNASGSSSRSVTSPASQDGSIISNKNLKLQTTNIFKWPEPDDPSSGRLKSPPQAPGKKLPEPKNKGCSSSTSSKKTDSASKIVLESDEITTEMKISEDPVVTVETAALPIESKGLFHTSDSFDEDGDLPYVPTTLPLEKPSVVPIFPSKERRSMSVTTTPVQRPKVNRPTPASINDYIAHSTSTVSRSSAEGEPAKMKINLPREDSQTEASGYSGLGNDTAGSSSSATTTGLVSSGSTKSPRRKSGSISATSWTDFAEMGLRSPRDIRRKLREEENLENGSPPGDDISSYHSDFSDAAVKGDRNRNFNRNSDEEGDALLKLPKVPFAMDLNVKNSQSSIHSQEEAQHSPRSVSPMP